MYVETYTSLCIYEISDKICHFQNLQLLAVKNIKLNFFIVTDGDVIYLGLKSGVL